MASRATNANKEDGTRAEEYVAEQVHGERTPNEWYDVLGPAPENRRIEVKSTQERLSSGRRGRFRLWRSQHERMKDADGRYWFLIDGREPFQRSPEEVSEVIDENGLSWTGSGSHEMDTEQVKIPWSHFIDPD